MKTQKTIQYKMRRGNYSGSLGLRLASIVAAAMFTLPTVVRSQTDEWIVYNTSNSGLPFNLIMGLACDEWGNVWIGTGDPFGNGGGLAKFDGENWTVYNTSNSDLPYNAVRALAPDTQGGIWIGTHGALGGVARGLAHFDGGNWMVYDTSNSSLPHNNVGALILDAQGNLWVGTDGGLARFDGVNWQVYTQANSGLPHNRISAIAIDDQGNKWIGTYGGGLAKFDGTNWETFNITNSGLPHNNVYAVAIDVQGNKWIGTAVHISGTVGGGLAMFDGQNWTVYNKANSPLPHDDVYAVAIDTDGSVWTGSGEHIPASVGGLTRFDGVDWTVYDKTNSGMPYNLVYALAIDGGGTKWIGSINFDEPGGLVAYRQLPVADFNGDLKVDFTDFSILAQYWGQDQSPFFDHRVDYNDLAVFTDYWLKGRPPGQASNPHPADYTEEVDINVDLSWTAGIGATSYDLYFGTSNPPPFLLNQVTTTFDPGTMVHSSTYYWRIDAVNAWGKTTGTVWSFTTIYSDLQASNPNPADDAIGIGIDTDLSWTAGVGAISHDVYFGTSNPPPFIQNQTTTTFDPGTMGYGTTYYWRIDEVDAYGTTTGTVWSFTTMMSPPPPPLP